MNKHKKALRILAALVALVLVALILLMANDLMGNPVSGALAARTAKAHVAQNHADIDLELSKPAFSFKTKNYYVHAQSATSIDTHFTMTINPLGKLLDDDYERCVVGRWNTRSRLDDQYNQQVKAVVEADSFPYPGYIKYGYLQSEWNDDLVLDQQADMLEMGRDYGELTLYIEDETISAQRASQILLDIKNIMDESGAGFARASLSLIKPRIDDQPNPDDSQFEVQNFPYEDIYEEGLVQRMITAADELQAYYAQKDAEKN